MPQVSGFGFRGLFGVYEPSWVQGRLGFRLGLDRRLRGNINTMWLRTILHKAARAQVIWTTYLLAEADGSHTCKGLPFLAQALHFKQNVAPALRGLRTKALPQLQKVSSGQGSIAGLNSTLAGGPGVH